MYTKGSIFGAFITLCILVIVTFSMGIKPTAAALILDDQSGDEGSTATFTVSIDSATNEIAALGFEVRYDPSVLRYSGYSAGSLTSGFDFFDANNASPGTVRVGGFVAGLDEIGQGASGTAVSLTFDVVGHDDCLVSLAQLKDDVKGWSTEPGYFTGDHVVEEEPADNPAPPPADSPIGEEVASNPTPPPAPPFMEEEPVDNPAPPPAELPIEEEVASNPPAPPPPSMEEEPSGYSASPPAPSLMDVQPVANLVPSPGPPSMEQEPADNSPSPPAEPSRGGSFNDIHYTGDTYRHQVNQATIKAGDINYSVYSNPDTDHSNPTSPSGDFNSETSKSVRAQHNVHKRAEAGKSHQNTKVAKLANNQEVLMVARARPKVNQMTANLNDPPYRNRAEAQLKPYLVEISDSGEAQKDGFRALIATMILFGSVYYLGIGVSILFAGYLFWELIKTGRRQLVAK